MGIEPYKRKKMSYNTIDAFINYYVDIDSIQSYPRVILNAENI